MGLNLKKFDSSDYQNLINWIQTPEFLMLWAGSLFNFPLTFEQLNEYRLSMFSENSTRRIYSVFEIETNKHIGHIELNNIDFINNSAKICRVLIGDKNVIGKGYGKEMVKAILRIGFEELKLHRIDLGVFDFNISAIKCYESAGFVHEGIFRESRKIGSQYWSLLQMSILDYEYAKRNN